MKSCFSSISEERDKLRDKLGGHYNRQQVNEKGVNLILAVKGTECKIKTLRKAVICNLLDMTSKREERLLQIINFKRLGKWLKYEMGI